MNWSGIHKHLKFFIKHPFLHDLEEEHTSKASVVRTDGKERTELLSELLMHEAEAMSLIQVVSMYF